MALLTWQQFIKQQGIVSLPLHEQKRRFLWENQQRMQRDWFVMNTAFGGAPGSAAASGTSGAGIDGPLNGATVTAAGVSVTTDTLGRFQFPIELTESDQVVITGGTDSITGLAFEGELKGFISGPENIISPITTLAAAAVEQGVYEFYTDAIDYVIDTLMPAFGFYTNENTRTEILTKDFIEASLTDSEEAFTAQAFSTYIDSTVELAAAMLLGTTTNSHGDVTDMAAAKSILYQHIVNNDGLVFDDFASTEVVEYDPAFASAAQLIDTTTTELGAYLTTINNNQKLDSNYRTAAIQSANRATKGVLKNTITAVKRGEIDASTITMDIDVIQSSVDTEFANLTKLEANRENVTLPTVSTSKPIIESDYTKVSYKLVDDRLPELTTYDLTTPVYYYGAGINSGTALYINQQDVLYGLSETLPGDRKPTAWTALTSQKVDPINPRSIIFYNWPTEIATTGYAGTVTSTINPSHLPYGQTINLQYQFTRGLTLYASSAPSSSSSYVQIGPFATINTTNSTRTELVGNFRIVTIADNIITSNINYNKWLTAFNQYFLVAESTKDGIALYDVLFASSYLSGSWTNTSPSVSSGTFAATFSIRKPLQPLPPPTGSDQSTPPPKKV
jgi:hypothetical protein